MGAIAIIGLLVATIFLPVALMADLIRDDIKAGRKTPYDYFWWLSVDPEYKKRFATNPKNWEVGDSIEKEVSRGTWAFAGYLEDAGENDCVVRTCKEEERLQTAEYSTELRSAEAARELAKRKEKNVQREKETKQERLEERVLDSQWERMHS